MGNSGSNLIPNSSHTGPSYRYTRIHGETSWSPSTHQANSNNHNSNSLDTTNQHHHHHHHNHHHHNHHHQAHHQQHNQVPPSPSNPITITTATTTTTRLPVDGAGGGTVKKRRNLASFATLRKKLGCKARRTSKSFDHSQVIKDFIVTWSTRDIIHLVEEYEITSILKELHIQAEVARPSASTVAQDLTDLFDCNYVADAYLLFKGHTFPVHKAIVCVRCPLFRELLGKINDFGAQIPVNLDVPGLRPDFFMDLLRYLYSGELYPSYSPNNALPPTTYDSILLKLSDQVPNSLEHDLKHLLETGLYSDAILVFTPPSLPLNQQVDPSSASSSATNPTSASSSSSAFDHHAATMPIKKCRSCSDQSEFSCHCAILASRSTFFRNMISRHQKRFTESRSEAGISSINLANQKIRIVIDESIIPRRFGRIILHCIYRDSTDLASLLPGCVCQCVPISESGHSSSSSKLSSTSSSNGQSFTSPSSYIKEIMELYEIGRFLELDSLIQSCEDMIIDSLSIDNLVSVLKWSEQPHGSPWVKRQALCFLREEFSLIASSPILYQLDLSHLKEAIKSDYLQASELEVLQALIKWGEDKLLKRMEEREPNVISQTAHSLRHGLRKKELNDDELRDIIAELMPYVRIGHILPPDSETLTNAVKRGLISTLPPYMLEEDSIAPHTRGISCWIRERSPGQFIRPRYFSPYQEEARNYLESRLSRQNDPNSMLNRPSKGPSQPPDTLYMTESSEMEVLPVGENSESLSAYANSVTYQEVYSNLSQLPVIEERIVLLMKQRVEELERYLSSSRNLSVIPNKSQVINYIQLRVVREFGLPDAAVDVLNPISNYVPYAVAESSVSASGNLTTSYEEANKSGLPSMSPSLSHYGSTTGGSSSEKDVYGYLPELRHETPNDYYQPLSESYLSNYSLNSEYLAAPIHQLSDVTPDIAMTTSAFADLNLMRKSTESLSCQPCIPPRRRARSNRDWRSDLKS